MSGFFKVPNEIIDLLMRHLKPVEFVCLMVVIRKTRGWHKGSDPIALSQFQKLTGIRSKSTITRALGVLSSEIVNLLDKRTSKGHSTVYGLSEAFNDLGGIDADIGARLRLARSKNWTGTDEKIGQVPVQNMDILHGVACPKYGHTKDIINTRKEAKQKNSLPVDNFNGEKPVNRQVIDNENAINGEDEKNALARSRQGLIEAGAQCGIEPTELETVSDFQARLLSSISSGVFSNGQ